MARRKVNFLSKEEEHDLAMRWRDQKDEKAMHKIVMAHQGMTSVEARRYRNYGILAQDLESEGFVGLLEAARRFDPDMGTRFSTFARWWIRAQIQDFILRNWSMVRGGSSSSQKSLLFNLRRMHVFIKNRNPDATNLEIFEEIARTLKVTPKDVEEMSTRLAGGVVSIDASRRDHENEEMTGKGFTLVSEEPLPDEVVEHVIDHERLKGRLCRFIGELPERDRYIMKVRHLEEQKQTLEEVGLTLGVSKERIRQLEARSMDRLRIMMTSQPEAMA